MTDKPLKRLSKREREFCENLAMTGRLRQAAILAGYAEQGASAQANRLLKREHVNKYYQALLQSRLTELGISKQSIQAKLVEMVNNKNTTDSDRLKALDMLNKMCGFYMRSLDKLLALSPEEIRQAIDEVKDVQHEVLTDGK